MKCCKPVETYQIKNVLNKIIDKMINLRGVIKKTEDFFYKHQTP